MAVWRTGVDEVSGTLAGPSFGIHLSRLGHAVADAMLVEDVGRVGRVGRRASGGASSRLSLKQTLSRHWFTFQRELFPWLEEALGPLGERYERLVRVLELVRVEEWLPYSGGWRGRPRQGEPRAKELRRLERQALMTLEEMLEDLPKVCDIGVKRNAKGHQESWTGYKLHIDAIGRRHSGQLPADVSLGARQSGGDPAGEADRESGRQPLRPDGQRLRRARDPGLQ